MTDAGARSRPGAPRVVVRGGGDLGTGVAHALARAGYRVVVLEMERPTAVRRAVAFAEAVRLGHTVVEGVRARRATGEDVEAVMADGDVPVLVDPLGEAIAVLRPDAVVDARMAKRNLGTHRGDAPFTIGLGPGFHAGRDVDVVIETARGAALGRIIVSGSALPNTSVPAAIEGAAAERVLRAPSAGVFRAARTIGDVVAAREIVGEVNGVAVRAGIRGLVRGLLADGSDVRSGDKLGDIDPRGAAVDPARMSDKARAVGAAVVAALLARAIAPRDEGSPSAGRDSGGAL